MTKPTAPSRDVVTRLVRRAVPLLKIGVIVTVYFALCVVIILSIVGARR
jgi:hypothetical protein